MTACVSPQFGALARIAPTRRFRRPITSVYPTPSRHQSDHHRAQSFYDEKEEERTDRRVDDRGDDARAKMNTDLGHQPFPDECSYDAYDEIANDPQIRCLARFGLPAILRRHLLSI